MGLKKVFAALGIVGAASTHLSIGEPAPAFVAQNQDGKAVQLADFKGQPVLIYFYPKDDTPGCTKEACQFRDDYSQFKKKGAVILGVSAQDAESHKNFKKKYHLPFDLLIDSDGKIAKSFGVGMMPVIGLHQRQSVLIDQHGKISKFYSSVSPQEHSQEVLADLEKMSH